MMYFIIVNSIEMIKKILFNPMYTCVYRFDPVRGHKLCISNFWNRKKRFIVKKVPMSSNTKQLCVYDYKIGVDTSQKY